MIYLRDFETEEQYDEFTGNTYSIPNVSSIRENGPDVRYNEYYNAPLTFQIIGDEDYAEGDTYSIFLRFDGEDTSYRIDDGIQYRINGGEWIYANFDEYQIDGLKPGDQVQFYNEFVTAYAYEDARSNLMANYFYCDAPFNVFGNINSLNDYDDQLDTMQYWALFYGNEELISAKNLILPSMTLEDKCYVSMFEGCTSLTTAPSLPATILTERCYEGMFYGCTSLTTAPELPATTLAEKCYMLMFSGCTSLTTAPELPATTLAVHCYTGMFYNCTSLTTAPELPATTLALGCYEGMFRGCTNLNYIKCLATDISASNCTRYWVISVASSGTFIKNSAMNSWIRGISGIPSNWTVVDNS